MKVILVLKHSICLSFEENTYSYFSEEVTLRRASMNKSPTKDVKPRPSASYDPDLRQKFQHVRTEEHQMTAARVSVQKGVPHADQLEKEELLKDLVKMFLL